MKVSRKISTDVKLGKFALKTEIPHLWHGFRKRTVQDVELGGITVKGYCYLLVDIINRNLLSAQKVFYQDKHFLLSAVS